MPFLLPQEELQSAAQFEKSAEESHRQSAAEEPPSCSDRTLPL